MTDRGVSVTVNYVMTLGIATLLLSSLLVATGEVVDDRSQEAIDTELHVIGERLVASLESADRLVLADGETVAIDVVLPERVAGAQYRIEVDPAAGGSTLVLATEDPPQQVTVGFANVTAVEATSVSGGGVRIVLAPDGELEVRRA